MQRAGGHGYTMHSGPSLMASDGVMNRRHESRSVPTRTRRGVKRPAEMQDTCKSPPKRPKTPDGVESFLMVMHPPEVLSHANSSSMSAIVEPIAPNVVNGISLRDMVPSNDAVAKLPTLPTLPQLAAHTSTNAPNVKGSVRTEENRRTEIASSMVETLSAQSDPLYRDILPDNGRRRQTSSSLCKRLIGMGAVALLLVDIYRSSSFHRASFLDKNISLSNFTITEMAEVKVDRALHRPPRKPSSLATSPYLLAIDNYERLKSTLAMVKKELAKVMRDLEDSRKNVGTAREEATTARNDYARVVFELDQTKNELMDDQRHIGLVLQELNHTQEELERTRRSLQVSKADLKATSDELDQTKNELMDKQRHIGLVLQELNHTQEELEYTRRSLQVSKADLKATLDELDQTKNELMDKQRHIGLVLQKLNRTQEELEYTRRSLQVSEADLKATSDELDAAHVTIGDLHHLLQVQETVAAHALNFVATTAVNRQYKCGDHATMSKQKGGDATTIEL